MTERQNQTTVATPSIARKIAAFPVHIQVGIEAYRVSLSKRQDWHAAVAAAIVAAEIAKEQANVG